MRIVAPFEHQLLNLRQVNERRYQLLAREPPPPLPPRELREKPDEPPEPPDRDDGLETPADSTLREKEDMDREMEDAESAPAQNDVFRSGMRPAATRSWQTLVQRSVRSNKTAQGKYRR